MDPVAHGDGFDLGDPARPPRSSAMQAIPKTSLRSRASLTRPSSTAAWDRSPADGTSRRTSAAFSIAIRSPTSLKDVCSKAWR